MTIQEQTKSSEVELAAEIIAQAIREQTEEIAARLWAIEEALLKDPE